jgi:hypothetical protein
VSNRVKILGGALIVLLAIGGWYTMNGSDDSAPPPTRSAGGFDPEGGGSAPRPAAGQPAAVHDVVELRVNDLVRIPRTFTPGRDPWRFVDPPPPPPPKPHVPTKAELEAMRLAEEARRRAAEEAARLAAIEAAKPHPPPFTWTYLGSFGPASKRIAVFTDGKTIYDAQQGEVLAGKWIVAQIGYESVDIRFVNFQDVPAQRLPVGH